MKLLPFVLAAVFVVVAIFLTLAVANSTGATTGGLQSAELMRLYERNRRVDVGGLRCLTLSDFDLPLDPEWTPLDPRLKSDEFLIYSLNARC